MIEYFPPFEYVAGLAIVGGILAFIEYPWLMPLY
jgi:hypothetical protein